MLPENITKVSETLMKFPSLGRRSSQKIALQILEQSDSEFNEFIQALQDMKHNISFCPICGFFSQNKEPCSICVDKNRSNFQICVVEKPTEELAMEKSMVYRGKYHVLNRLISPLDNIFAPNTNIPGLLTRLQDLFTDFKNGKLTSLKAQESIELILFLQPGFNAEATTAYIREKIHEIGLSSFVNVTKMAQGLPSYYNIDTLDQETLARAIEGRIKA